MRVLIPDEIYADKRRNTLRRFLERIDQFHRQGKLLPMIKIARALDVAETTVCNVLRTLEACGMMYREPCVSGHFRDKWFICDQYLIREADNESQRPANQ